VDLGGFYAKRAKLRFLETIEIRLYSQDEEGSQVQYLMSQNIFSSIVQYHPHPLLSDNVPNTNYYAQNHARLTFKHRKNFPDELFR